MDKSEQVSQDLKQADSNATKSEYGSQDKGATLASLATERLEQQILQRPSIALKNRCVFYTSVPKEEEDQEEFNERKNIESVNINRGLCLIATAWAVSYGKSTIWTVVSYSENDIIGDSSGTVYVVSMRPKQLSKYKDIWGNVAYPELLARSSAGQDRAPTKLISVDAVNPNNQFLLDWNSQEVQKAVEPEDPDYLELEEPQVHNRDTCNCTANVEYEPPGEDWFG
ncbi:hypothetical protein ABKA04_005289 [Annulohypoxylon sp. FPYF3050]